MPRFKKHPTLKSMRCPYKKSLKSLIWTKPQLDLPEKCKSQSNRYALITEAMLPIKQLEGLKTNAPISTSHQAMGKLKSLATS